MWSNCAKASYILATQCSTFLRWFRRLVIPWKGQMKQNRNGYLHPKNMMPNPSPNMFFLTLIIARSFKQYTTCSTLKSTGKISWIDLAPCHTWHKTNTPPQQFKKRKTFYGTNIQKIILNFIHNQNSKYKNEGKNLHKWTADDMN